MTSNKPINKYAFTAGISLILMALSAGFAFGYAHSQLLAPNDATATLENLLNSKPLLTAEILAWWLILALDVIVAWALYHFFKNVNKPISALTAWIRVVYSIILGIAISHLVLVCYHISASNETSAETVMSHMQAFETIWSLGLIVFGFHLIGLGWLALKSKLQFWGVLLFVAGFSYTFIHLLKQFPSAESLTANAEMVLSIPMAFAEIGLAVWLLVRGRKRSAAT
jgi:hypothetical protein